MVEFLTIGEPLVVFAADDTDVPLEDVSKFSKFLAGAELNVAIGVRRLGHSSAYVSAIGADFMGNYLRKGLEEHHVSAKYISIDPEYPTGFYFKESVSDGDPQVKYYRSGSAASHITTDSLEKIDLTEIKLLHVSGIFGAISKSACETAEKLMDLARESETLITFDPNLRPSLWKSQSEMVTTLNKLAKKAKVILPGISEGEVLTGSRNPEEIAKFYLQQSDYTETVIIKLGASGAYVKKRGKECYIIPGFKVEHVVDTVGAGDGFAVGVITSLLEGRDFKEGARRGCAIGALAIQSASDNGGYPTSEELAKFYQTNEK